MKIKLHNSLAKCYEKSKWLSSFIFDDKTFIHLSKANDLILFTYKANDMNFFLGFNLPDQTMEVWWGFGDNRKNTDPNWFKDKSKFKEIAK